MGIQLDYGGFDPSFIGVTIRFSKLSAWENWQKFITNSEPLPFDHLMPEQRFEALSAVTVFPHEIRHFHDFLLTPYSAHIFRQRVLTLTHVMQMLFPFMFTEEANCLPVPISVWCRLTENKRKQVLAMFQSGMKNTVLCPINMPYIEEDISITTGMKGILSPSQETFDEFVRRSIFYYEKIDQFTHNPQTVHGKFSLQPWQIFELSGLIVQLQSIWHMYGLEDYNIFREHIMAANNTAYAEILNIAFVMSKRSHLSLDSAVSAVAIWSLLGSYDVDAWKACPSYRFIRLWGLVRQEGFPDTLDDLEKVFNDWSSKLGLSTVNEGLASTQKTFHDLCISIEKYLDTSNLIIPMEYLELIFRFVNCIAKANDHMIKQFNNDPSSYVIPRRYVNSTERFVNPIVKVSFEGGMRLKASFQEMEAKGFIIDWAEDKNGEILIRSMITTAMASQHHYLNVEDVQLVSTLMGLTDFLLAKKSRVRAEVQLPGRIFFRESHIKPIQLDSINITR